MTAHRQIALASIAVLAGGLAYAADQTILGSQLLVKNPSTFSKRKIIGKAKEIGSPNTIVGSPVALGGLLVIRANGGTPSSQSFSLPQGTSAITGKSFWTGDAVKGFKYKDPKHENGPVKIAMIKKSASGTFAIKTIVLGKNGLVLVLPPNPGTGGCMLLAIVGGDSYSVQFGPTSQITNKGAELFRAKKPTIEGSCLTTTTTSSTTTSTTLYGSPSRAFVDRVLGLLD